MSNNDDNRHQIHLFVTEKEVAMYFKMFEERIEKHENLLKRVEETVYESIVKKEKKMREHSDAIELLENMYNEIREQTAW